MAQITEMLGFAGALISVASYAPQVAHVLKKKCVHGISLTAWSGWFVSTALIMPHALLVGDWLFIFLQVISLIACGAMIGLAKHYDGKKCGECAGKGNG